jgi:hypothetical protein
MRKPITPVRRFRTCLLVLALGALAFVLPTLTAPRRARADDAPKGKAPLAIYPGYERFDARTKATVMLPSRRYGLAVQAEQAAYRLDPLDAADVGQTAPNQVGVGRRLDLVSSLQGERFANADGSKVRFLAVIAPGAKGLRLHIADFNLPEGDEVYVYGSAANSHVAGPYSGRGPFDNGDFWADAVEGETVIVEHFIRRHETGFRLPEVSHIYGDVVPDAVSPRVLSCEVDASCFGEPEKDAVGRMLFQVGGSAFVCTGTMINNNSGDFTPLFLTAAHCISGEDEARSLQVYWFYQTISCNNMSVRQNSPVTSGAIILGTSRAADSTLLKLTGPIPPGVAFAGWDASVARTGSPVIGLHHPGGSIPPGPTSALRRSRGSLYYNYLSCSASGLSNGYVAIWDNGITEPGSSGSGLFQNSQLVGVLSCGPANVTCTNNFSLYGRLTDFYPLVQPFLERGSSFDNCIDSLVASRQSFDADGGIASVVVNASPNCIWQAVSDSDWLVLLSGSSGTGGKLMGFALEKNTGPPRDGRIVIQNKILSIHQDGVPCAYTLTPAAQSLPSSAGTGSINVLTPGGCAWTASSDVSWIIFTAARGNGEGAVSFEVEANQTGSARTGHIIVGDQTVALTQETGPTISRAEVQGKQLIVTGFNFVDGADLLVGGVRQKKTGNDPASPTTVIAARKSGKDIASGQTVVLQVRNPDGKLSPEFRFTRP